MRGAHLHGFAPRPTASHVKVATVASHWQRVGDLNPIPPAPEANVLPLVRLEPELDGPKPQPWAK